MEEHLRQLIVDAGHDDTVPTVTGVQDMRSSFRHAAAADPRAASRARVERLIALGRGLDDFELPPRDVGTIKDVDFS